MTGDALSKGTYKSCTTEQRSVLRICQWINFGRIEGLKISKGVPSFTKDVKFIREAKLDAAGMPRREMDLPDFILKDQHISLFDYMDYLGDGVMTIKVMHGLPFQCFFEDHL